jgi:hypothetical protein
MNKGPLFLCYDSTPDVETLAKPGAIFVTGPGNWDRSAFQRARALGAEVWQYVIAMERPNSSSNKLVLDAFMGDLSKVPLWGGGRFGWPGTMLADIRVGSKWSNYFVDDFMSSIMASGRMDGAWIDGLGCRLFKKEAAWTTWPASERAEWTAGNVDLARRLDARRLQINPHFVLHANGLWVNPDENIDASVAEKYVDGVCMESPPVGAPADGFNAIYVKRPFANRGRRRVTVIADNESEAKIWAARPGVTHVTSVNRSKNEDYKRPTRAVVPYVDGRLAEERAFARWFAAERQRLLSTGSTDAQLIAERDAARAERDAALADGAEYKTANAALAVKLNDIHRMSAP